MKELENVLDSFVTHVADSLRDLDKALQLEASYKDSDIHERVRGIRVGARHLQSLCGELLDDIQQRVYCVEVESTLTQTIKILAKNEQDAGRMAVDVAESRLRFTFGEQYDYDVYSSYLNLGDESKFDDEADEEYPYDGR